MSSLSDPCLEFSRLQDAPAQTWRNGGGVTRELLAWSAGEVRADTGVAWELRVSVADITRDGPFSAFPGIRRCFAVLEGDGVELMLDGQARRLTSVDDPLGFDGAAAPGCRLLGGATRDLNLMVRASVGRARMARAAPGVPQERRGPWQGVYVHGPAAIDLGQGAQALPAAGLAWTAKPVRDGLGMDADAFRSPWTLIEGGPAWWLWLEALQQEP